MSLLLFAIQTPQEFLRGKEAPWPLFRESLESYVKAETEYRAAKYAEAHKTLETFWRKHPPGTQEWQDAFRDSREARERYGINIGSPPAYAALRMLTSATQWRRTGAKPSNPTKATLTVVLVGKAKGLEPQSMDDLKAGRGVSKVYRLEPKLDDQIKESLWLFQEYFLASTKGGMRVDISLQKLPNHETPVRSTWNERGFSGLADEAWTPVWNAIPKETKAKTDWWWILYPSAVPEHRPDFKTTEFVTGGMGIGPDGGSPCFIIDDRWLTRKPPHLGYGPMTSLERRTYLPQWVAHEFFHHLFRIYPEFGLEKKGHDWFDRSTWPKDFEGRLEPDYYHEAMTKRFMDSKPRLASRLRYAAPPEALFQGLDPVGKYQHEPVQNPWHEGEILRIGGKLMWRNKAGKEWSLELRSGRLLTGPDCPYFETPLGKSFELALQKTERGDYLPKLDGFRFGGGFYRRL